MDVLKVLAGLRNYKAELDEAISRLDRLARKRGDVPRAGRKAVSSRTAGRTPAKSKRTPMRAGRKGRP